MPSTETKDAIEILDKFISVRGHPEIIVSDNEPQFRIKFEDWCKENSIKALISPPYHPQSNGLAERYVDTDKKALKKMNPKNLQRELNKYLKMYRNTPRKD